MKKILLISSILLCLNSWAEKDNKYVQALDRDIKALADVDIENYLQGAGMGFAMAAELNKYPGPKHVLDLASQLEMTAKQIYKSKILFEHMRAKAILLGRELVEEEKTLDRLFKNNEIEAIILRKKLDKIAAVKSRLRFIHLSAHLQQKTILSQQQITQYDVLRGYSSGYSHDHSNHTL